MGDVGSAGGPLIASFIAGVANLGLAAAVTSILGFIGAALMWLTVPESLRQ